MRLDGPGAKRCQIAMTGLGQSAPKGLGWAHGRRDRGEYCQSGTAAQCPQEDTLSGILGLS